MSAQHIAGLPVEEILLAAVATAAPLIALIGWEIRDRVRRMRRRLSRHHDLLESVPDVPPEAHRAAAPEHPAGPPRGATAPSAG